MRHLQVLQAAQVLALQRLQPLHRGAFWAFSRRSYRRKWLETSTNHDRKRVFETNRFFTRFDLVTKRKRLYFCFWLIIFADFRPSLPVGEQLHRQAKLQVLLLLPDIPQRAHDQHIHVEPGVRAEEAGQPDGEGADRGVSFTFVYTKSAPRSRVVSLIRSQYHTDGARDTARDTDLRPDRFPHGARVQGQDDERTSHG